MECHNREDQVKGFTGLKVHNIILERVCNSCVSEVKMVANIIFFSEIRNKYMQLIFSHFRPGKFCEGVIIHPKHIVFKYMHTENLFNHILTFGSKDFQSQITM